MDGRAEVAKDVKSPENPSRRSVYQASRYFIMNLLFKKFVGLCGKLLEPGIVGVFKSSTHFTLMRPRHPRLRRRLP